MKLDERIEGLAAQFNANEEELTKLRDALRAREDLKLEITGALKALNSIKEEEPAEEPKTKKKAKA